VANSLLPASIGARHLLRVCLVHADLLSSNSVPPLRARHEVPHGQLIANAVGFVATEMDLRATKACEQLLRHLVAEPPKMIRYPAPTVHGHPVYSVLS